MKSLMRYLKNYRRECVLAPLFKMLEASFELLVPLVMAAVIDRGIGMGDRPFILRMALVLAALAAVGLVSSITAQYFSARAATGFATGVRHALFERLESLSFSNMDEMGVSTMITRLTSDVNQAQTGVNMTLRLFLRSPFVVFGAMVMAFTIDVKCALIFVFAIAALAAVVFGIMAVNIPMMRGVQAALERVLGATRENLEGARVIRAFCNEDRQYAEFVDKNRELNRRQRRAGRVSGLMNPATFLLINAAIAWLIYTGAVRVDNGVLSAGQVVALYNYMSQILVELIKLANLIVTMNKGLASWKRIEDALNLTSDMTSPETTAPAIQCDEAVRFDHVSLRYRGAGAETLSDVSFTALKGETIGVIGGTGSGKTSVVGLIDRFYDATSGSVSVNGLDVRQWNEADLRSRVGFVLQRAVLFQGTIRDNLRWGREDATDEELLKAAHIAQADDVLAAKGGLDAEIEQNGRNLSGGQRQRLTIARALVRKSGNSGAGRQRVGAGSGHRPAAARGHPRDGQRPTVFIVSQRTASIRQADRILVMDDGKLVGSGTHEELLESCPVYREIYESQYGGEASA